MQGFRFIGSQRRSVDLRDGVGLGTGHYEELLDALPQLPARALVTTTELVVIEWLESNEERTGEKLCAWANERRPGWARYIACQGASEIFDAIETTTLRVARSNAKPILHFEGHGDVDGLIGRTRAQEVEILKWDALTRPLQTLNGSTGCNLTVFVAACEGYAALRALCTGPVCPAVTVAGPTEKVNAGELLRATQELYRRWIDGRSSYGDAIDSAERELANGVIESTSGPVMFFEGFFRALITRAKTQKLSPCARMLQGLWDQAFFIDRFPENAQRFGVNIHEACRRIDAFFDRAGSTRL